jgi:hypothetical protein
VETYGVSQAQSSHGGGASEYGAAERPGRNHRRARALEPTGNQIITIFYGLSSNGYGSHAGFDSNAEQVIPALNAIHSSQ